MRQIIIVLIAVFLSLSTAAKQQQMDTILLFDYRENPAIFVRDGKGFGEDYLQIIINKNDTINLDAREAKHKIKFKHKIFFNNNSKKKSSRNIFDNIQFAGLQIIKPAGESIELKVKSHFHYHFKTKKTHQIDTSLIISTIPRHTMVLWNLYDFDTGVGERVNYFYPRYTLHNYNWPTAAELADNKRVLRQIEKAIVYRYNTVTRQIVKS